jgi:hypothetical protein
MAWWLAACTNGGPYAFFPATPGGSTITLYTAGNVQATGTVLAQTVSQPNGAFAFGSYSCPAPDALVYAIASGGSGTASLDSAMTGRNSSIQLMAALGPCESVPAKFVINEITTVAAVYALNAFRTPNSADPLGDMTQLRGISPAIDNAFATAALLADVTTGLPAASLPMPISCPDFYTVTVNCFGLGRLTALSNALAACVRTSLGSDSCAQLYADTNATNTLQATLYIARNPGLVNVSDIYNLSTQNPFAAWNVGSRYGRMYFPGLSTAPTDWTLSLNFSGNGLTNVGTLAIDANGNVWVAAGTNRVSAFNSSGAPLSGSPYLASPTNGSIGSIAIDGAGLLWAPIYEYNNGPPGGPGIGAVSVLNPNGSVHAYYTSSVGLLDLAIDGSGNVWAVGTQSLTVFNSSGIRLLGSPFSVTGLNDTSGGSIAIDEHGTAWIQNSLDAVVAVDSQGTAATGSPFSGGGLAGSLGNFPLGIAIDASGNVWVANGSGVTELPAGTPLAPVDFITDTSGCSGCARGLAVDGGDNVWVANRAGFLSELSPNGTLLSPQGFAVASGLGPENVAIDGAGDVWVTSASKTGNVPAPSITEFIGVAAPTVTPLAAQLSGPVNRTPPPPITYSIGGSVSGLTGQGLVLQDNGGDNLNVTVNGSFTFAKSLLSGAKYAVAVATQPTGQTCTVTNAGGTVGSTKVINVAVTCAANATGTYTVGGTVNFLPGGVTVTLQNNGVDTLTVTANGPFTFATPIATGGTYYVTAVVNPSSVMCPVSNASGTVGSANVTNIIVSCL